MLLFHLRENAYVASCIGKFQFQRLVRTDDYAFVLAGSGILVGLLAIAPIFEAIGSHGKETEIEIKVTLDAVVQYTHEPLLSTPLSKGDVFVGGTSEETDVVPDDGNNLNEIRTNLSQKSQPLD